ncbi:hypothetical protein ACXPWS_15330 [Mycobacterium sp. BMJ-28]
MIGAALTAIAIALAVIGAATQGFGLASSAERPSAAQAAPDRCTAEVLSRLAAPSTARLSNATVARTDLDPDSKDLFSLLDDPLRGVDHSRITVLNISGAVDAPNTFGATIHGPFSCRAYFVDGTLAHTLVLLDHDH